MPLYDHFHEPLKSRRSWTAFCAAWATYLSEDLNAELPDGYFAEPTAQFALEIDVATWEDAGGPPRSEGGSRSLWAPPAPQATLPLVIVTDIVEVRIQRTEGGLMLAGAVELVSPANKDRPASRDAFVSKCASYVQAGAGLALVDVVTERRANLHQEFLTRVSPGSSSLDAELYAASYRPVHQKGENTLEMWQEALALGQPLPTLPLWLRGGPCVPLRLDLTYEHAARMLRFPVNGT